MPPTLAQSRPRRTSASPARTAAVATARTPVAKKPAAKTTGSKKDSPWAKYQALLVRKPILMNFTQSTIISAAGAITAQTLFMPAYDFSQVWKMSVVLTNLVIVPVNMKWFQFLGSLKLHWAAAACLDQFVFSPFFLNILIFWFLDAYDGGLALSFPTTPSTASIMLTFTRSKFSDVLSFAPMWRTQLIAYTIWLPAALAREAVVPPHLRPVFINICGFVWNIIFTLVLTL